LFCEYCNKEHLGNFGSGRFCSNYCAKGFSTKKDRLEINKKISISLKGKGFHGGRPFEKGHKSYWNEVSHKKASETRIRNIKNFIYNSSWENLGYSQKRVRVLYEQKGKCNNCGLITWGNSKLSLEYHHKDGDSCNNVRNNVEFLCPNCHSQTKTYCRKKSSLKK